MEWHRLFGLLLTDFFAGSPFAVEIERDLSTQQQRLDVLIVRRGKGRFAGLLPDGLDNLAPHNLFTFKSHRQPLDPWALMELIGHFVSYRKLVSLSTTELLPESHFRLYAISARYPHNLASQLPWQQVQAGVYDCRWGTVTIRVVVAGQLAKVAHNAPLHLFSAVPELVQFGQEHYQQRLEKTSGLLGQLFESYEGEGLDMYTMDDFHREYLKNHLKDFTPEERLEGLSPEERLKGLRPEERLKDLPLEERLKGLPVEALEEYLRQSKAASSTPKRSKRSRPRRDQPKG